MNRCPAHSVFLLARFRRHASGALQCRSDPQAGRLMCKTPNGLNQVKSFLDHAFLSPVHSINVDFSEGFTLQSHCLYLQNTTLIGPQKNVDIQQVYTQKERPAAVLISGAKHVSITTNMCSSEGSGSSRQKRPHAHHRHPHSARYPYQSRFCNLFPPRRSRHTLTTPILNFASRQTMATVDYSIWINLFRKAPAPQFIPDVSRQTRGVKKTKSEFVVDLR